MEQLAEPIVVRGHRHTLAVSIGVTVSGPWHEHPDEVLRQADQALVRAKRGGRGRAEVYDPTQDKLATVEDLQLEHALRTAINDRVGILPYFQPIISIADNKTVGYEALARWVHPEKGLLSPAVFLPLAEQTGLIRSLGWLMLDQSCRAATNPDELGGRSRWIAVNASGSQLGCHQLVPAIERALEQSGLAPQRLHLEITEAELVDLGPAAVAEIHAVAEMGVGIALDDFGTGYSSLSLLRDLPVSTVKIDRSFVAPIAVDRSATAIVRSVIGLCQELGVTTVAEGVETDEQLTTLRALGCSQAQGFLFGRPAPVTTRRARTSLVRRIRL
jgi:predicted signal transduction protein with EAL and GGDEF domain